MAMVHRRPDWWIEPEAGDRMGPPGAVLVPATLRGVRPLGPRSWFVSRPTIEVCLNCGTWIHPGRGAWFDPDSSETVCAGCWPEAITARCRP
jgi:hypothetical protein